MANKLFRLMADIKREPWMSRQKGTKPTTWNYIVRAPDETSARLMVAQDSWERYDWIDPSKTSCEEIKTTGRSEVLCYAAFNE